MATASVVASDLVGNGETGSDFACELAVGVGFDGDGNFYTLDKAKLFENKDVWIVFVGVVVDVFPRNVDGGELAV